MKKEKHVNNFVHLMSSAVFFAQAQIDLAQAVFLRVMDIVIQ